MTDLLLIARAELMTDWHVFIDDPHRGPLGYCAAHGADDIDLDTGEVLTEPWAPHLATQALADGGWEVVGEWRDAPLDAEHAYEVPVRRRQAASDDDFVADRRADINEDAFELGDAGREGYHS